MNNINELKLLCEGGVGLILESENNDIIKLLLMHNIYNNNIKYFNKLYNKIPVVQIKKYNIKTFNYNNISNKVIQDYLLTKKDLLNKIYNNEKIIDIKIYSINYERYDTNLYNYLLVLKYEKNYEELYNNLIYIIYWLVIIILSLNKMNICHNDFKLDNILVKENKNNKFINFNNSYSLFNTTNINLYLNDFDKTMTNTEKTELVDLNFLKIKLFKLFDLLIDKDKKNDDNDNKDDDNKDNDNKDKIKLINLIEKLKNKLNKTTTIKDIENLWIINSTTYTKLNICSSLITNYLKDKLKK